MAEKHILIPVDYSATSLVSLDHAYTLAKEFGADIELLHVVDDPDEVEAAEKKLADFAAVGKEAIAGEVELHETVVVGNFIKEIGERAESLHAMMIVMGNHGVKGLQFLTGSHSIRIVSKTNTPFVIVQERGVRNEGYKSIVAPMDLHTSTKQKLKLIADIASHFGSTVHLVCPTEKDEFHHNALERNMKYAERYLDEHGISYTARIAPEHSRDLDKAVSHLAAAEDADLIAIMNWGDPGFFESIGEHNTTQIINNDLQVPVLVMNPRSTGEFSIIGGWPTP